MSDLTTLASATGLVQPAFPVRYLHVTTQGHPIDYVRVFSVDLVRAYRQGRTAVLHGHHRDTSYATVGLRDALRDQIEKQVPYRELELTPDATWEWIWIPSVLSPSYRTDSKVWASLTSTHAVFLDPAFVQAFPNVTVEMPEGERKIPLWLKKPNTYVISRQMGIMSPTFKRPGDGIDWIRRQSKATRDRVLGEIEVGPNGVIWKGSPAPRKSIPEILTPEAFPWDRRLMEWMISDLDLHGEYPDATGQDPTNRAYAWARANQCPVEGVSKMRAMLHGMTMNGVDKVPKPLL